jgi:glycine/D-amino acid oxidase-like deaminating enzyme
MRVIVVGAGVVGLLTAVECVTAGQEVTLLDAAGPRHPHAASQDTHRVVRASHPGNRRLTLAAGRALAAWRALGERLHTLFVTEVGALAALPALALAAAVDDLAATGEPVTALHPGALAAACPLPAFPAATAAVLEPRAGVVLAERALDTVLAWLRAQPGVVVKTGQRAVSVAAGTVRLADGTELSGDAVLVAAGPWSRDLLPEALRARLVLNRQTTLYCRPSGWAGLPVIPSFGTAAGAWLVPPVAGTALRCSANGACREVPEIDGFTAPARWRDYLIGEFAALLPGFGDDDVVDAQDAYYLSDPVTNEPLLVGENAGRGAVWQLAACGGMSFKFAPLIAAAMAARAAGATAPPTGLAGVDEPLLATAEGSDR